MPIEAVTTIDTLDASSPTHDESLGDIDSHLRNIKGALKATFPKVNGPVLLNQGEINALPGFVSSTAAQTLSQAVSQAVAQANLYTSNRVGQEAQDRYNGDVAEANARTAAYVDYVNTKANQLQANINAANAAVAGEAATRGNQDGALSARINALGNDFRVVDLGNGYYRAELYGGLRICMGYALGVGNNGVVAYNFHFNNLFTLLVSDASSAGNIVGAWKRDAETFVAWVHDSAGNPTSTLINFIAVGI